MARKRVEEMSKDELEGLIGWMEGRIRYMKFLIADKFSN